MEWGSRKLVDAPLDIIDGDRGINYPKKTDFFESSYCLFLNAGNITSSGLRFTENAFIDEERDNLLRKGKLERYDVILTTRGTVGNVGYYDDSVKYKHLRINSGMVILRANEEELLSNYLYLYLRSPLFKSQVIALTTGSAQPQLPIRDINRIDIPIPPLTKQKAIASVLGALDDKIENNRQMNETLEEMAQILFRQWFIEEVGEDWEEVKLGDTVEISIGRTPPRKEFHWFSKGKGDWKWISIKDMGGDGVYVFNTSEYLTQEATNRFRIPVIPENTVVLSFKMTLGRVKITTEEMLSNEAIAHFKFNLKTPFSKEYLYFYLTNFRFGSLGSTSSIVTAINSTMIKEMLIVLPDQKTMDKFRQTSKPIFHKIFSNQSQIRTLENLRDTLLPKLMNGEIHIKDAEQEVGAIA